MFKDSSAFSSFSTDDINAAKEFYVGVLGLDAGIGEMGVLRLAVPGGGTVMIYPKEDHQPAAFTVLVHGSRRKYTFRHRKLKKGPPKRPFCARDFSAYY